MKNGGAYIENAQITRTDINVSNGVIHVIDAVLAPVQLVEPEPEPEPVDPTTIPQPW